MHSGITYARTTVRITLITFFDFLVCFHSRLLIRCVLIYRNVKQFVLGSGNLIFNVTVENKGEDSFGTVFKMRIPPGVHYSKFEDLSKGDLSSYMQCYSPKFDNNYTINCDIGNPLPKNRNVSLYVTKYLL